VLKELDFNFKIRVPLDSPADTSNCPVGEGVFHSKSYYKVFDNRRPVMITFDQSIPIGLKASAEGIGLQLQDPGTFR
jgi:hypothetical protein